MSAFKRTMRAIWFVPNVLSLFRGCVAGPIIAIVYLVEFSDHHVATTAIKPEMFGNYPVWTFWLVVAVALSDGLDGLLARMFRQYGWQTRKGGEIDAYNDKLLGVFVLYIAVPLHYWMQWFLLPYFLALAYIAQYSFRTTAMRHKRLIAKAGRVAQWKTAILMGVKVVAFANIAFFNSDAVLWFVATATCAAAVLCYFAMNQYKGMAPYAAPAE